MLPGHLLPSPDPLSRVRAGPHFQDMPRVLGRLVSQRLSKLISFKYLFDVYLREWLMTTV